MLKLLFSSVPRKTIDAIKAYFVVIGVMVCYILLFAVGTILDPFWVSFVADLIGIGLALLCYKIYCGPLFFRTAHVKINSSRGVIYLVFYFIFTIYASLMLSIYVLHKIPSSSSGVDIYSSSTEETYGVWFILFAAIIAPLTEELIMRFFAYTYLKRHSHWILAMLFTSVIFGAFHGTWHQFIAGVVFGISSTLLYEYSGTITVSILYHMIYNWIALMTTESMLFTNETSFYVLMFLYIGVIISFMARIYAEKNRRHGTDFSGF